MEDDKAHITIYTFIGRPERVKEALVSKFAEGTKKVGKAIVDEKGIEVFSIRLKDRSEMEFHIPSDREFIDSHIAGMHELYRQVRCVDRDLHQSVLNQISVFNCVVGCSFEPDDNDDRMNYILGSIFAAAKEVNGLIMMPDMSLFNGDGELVLSIEGKSDLSEYTPIGNADAIDGSEEESPEDAARRERSIAVLKQKNISYLPTLRSAVAEAKANIRQPEEVARRLFAMFAVCVYCEARGGGETWDEAQKYLEKADETLGGLLRDSLSPRRKSSWPSKTPTRNGLRSSDGGMNAATSLCGRSGSKKSLDIRIIYATLPAWRRYSGDNTI